MEEKHGSGQETLSWKLENFFYSGHDDPKIESDFQELEYLMTSLERDHRGRVKETLGNMLNKLIAIEELGVKITLYFELATSLDTTDAEMGAAKQKAQARFADLRASKRTFVELEISAITETEVRAIADTDETVRHHLPYLRKIINERPYQLTEATEASLARRRPFGPPAWKQLYEKQRAKVRVDLNGEQLTLGAASSRLTTEADPDKRAAIQHAMHVALSGDFADLAADTLHATVGTKRADDKERGYAHPMRWRNIQNGFTDSCTEALHEAVIAEGPELCRRYYGLLASLLGLSLPIRWGDRNAPLVQLAQTKLVTPEESFHIVLAADRAFCPEWAEILERAAREGRIETRRSPLHRGGASNYSYCLPNHHPGSWTFMTHEGADRDTKTLAHESGHMIQGEKAGKKQGALQMDPPLGVAEIASIFNELVVIDYRLAQARGEGNDRETLRLVMGSIGGSMNSIVRQINFSLFERELHGHDGKNLGFLPLEKKTPRQLEEMFRRATVACYGPSGTTLDMTDSESTWAAIPHLYAPFYFPAYSADDVIARALMLRRERFGRDFVPRINELFERSGTATLAELLAPLEVETEGHGSWRTLLREGVGQMLDQAEAAAARLGYVVK